VPRRVPLDAVHPVGHVGEVGVAGDLADGELSPVRAGALSLSHWHVGLLTPRVPAVSTV
jgi:hypothetical protein